MKNQDKVKTGAAGMARATKGRARVFKNRKRESARRACRGRVQI